MRAWLLALVCACTASAAGPLQIGLKGGIPLTDFFSAVKNTNFTFNPNTHSYLVGASLELRLPMGFGLEVDALYRRMKYSGATTTSTQSVTGNGFEFPALVKYRFSSGGIQPFVDAGVSFDSLRGLTQTFTSKTGLTSSPPSAKFTKGFVMGGGFDLNLKLLHIVPEIRYTHWGSSRIQDPLNMVLGSKNQGEFLLGVTF
jgi:hypothetical protein